VLHRRFQLGSKPEPMASVSRVLDIEPFRAHFYFSDIPILANAARWLTACSEIAGGMTSTRLPAAKIIEIPQFMPAARAKAKATEKVVAQAL